MICLETFDEELIAKKAAAMLVFTADWCRPCGLQKPVIEKLAGQFGGQILIQIIDVDQHAGLADRLMVKTLPATLLYADGELVEHLHGYQAEDFLTAYLKHIIENRKNKDFMVPEST
jgi:thioredoxin-like negative regulator of GroEL